MPQGEEGSDHFQGKTDEEFLHEEREARRRSSRNPFRRWRQHPLNPASEASVRYYRAAAIIIALVLMSIFLFFITLGRDVGGFAIAASSTSVALAIAVGARSR
ncbi:MAG: hypothetical protein DCC49_01220 [Acidobacteria bacterium]|nr:MAG: hypothetical protein DCC49_01220 [Acidobacteriota bacterium]